ncbi:hypothetical protein ASE12_09185 [Aeromicrobium sp. Root236]|uniref:hypothetical protein n=1 Tax=Aeromicrobium sp. Root236 TaxID=1736498 RepID=UPI000701B4C6|nr:hypothetical protein [Aeromicrobium sp. Root236]KRC64919.1 hypothetical protein ASE12_09185 [Aeromicrobium sp. Root236]
MTDDTLDRLVRDADPHDPDAVRDLRGAGQVLLEEIMSTTPVTSITKRRRTRVAAIGLAAAAVLAVAVSVPALLTDSDTAPGRDGQTVHVGTGTDRIAYSAAAVEVARNNPRLLIGEPGWKATTVYGFAKDSGTIVFSKGDREVEMNWYPASRYQSYYDDRSEISKRTPITIDGQKGSRVSYSDTDIAAMLEPKGPTFVEIRTGGPGFTSTAEVLKLFGSLEHVTVNSWLAALPVEIVTPGKIAKVADEILADVPLPPGFDKAGLAKLGVNDRYQFSAETVSLVVCGWLDVWQRADAKGDTATAQRVVAALSTARDWKVLDEMQKTGEYSPGVWDLADKVKVGDDPRTYQKNFQCSGE